MYPQGTIRRALGLGLLVTFVVLALSACGGGASGSEQQQAKARPLPESTQDLSPGEYQTEVFEPALSFAVGEGWALECLRRGQISCASSPRQSRRA
jgi:hypothetical protein